MKIGRYLYRLCLFNNKLIIKGSNQCSIKDRTDNLMTTFFLTAEKKKIYVKTCIELDLSICTFRALKSLK